MKRPTSAKEWEAVIAAAPGTDRPLTAKEKRQWDNAVVVHTKRLIYWSVTEYCLVVCSNVMFTGL